VDMVNFFLRVGIEFCITQMNCIFTNLEYGCKTYHNTVITPDFMAQSIGVIKD